MAAQTAHSKKVVHSGKELAYIQFHSS